MTSLPFVVHATKYQCAVSPQQRKDCGYPGIRAETCHQRGCCFDASITDVPWCFTPFSKLATGECAMDVYKRRECGFPGISEEQCEERGCCFDSNYPGVRWCFHPLTRKDY
ncbi:trefoil factor 2-like [Alligator mississippiensis]|uniref:Trefoil factor 2-like n=1 Tax=Alligator mississippiensis TaxID=8496 RepID=A0A151NQE2_ALLMI|nr:trefoil factor 2-like [Alligator mississippiensis]